MPKALCIFGMAISILLLLLFGLDLAAGFPFKGHSTAMDLGMILGSCVLAYLSWSTFREQV